MDLIEAASRFIFFTGKGGVGKTSTSCAVAIALADRGRNVLLVSTDPASNLEEVLGMRVDSAPSAHPGVRGLSALNVDPHRAAAAYRERVIGPYRGALPAAALASIEEQFAGACTVEIAAFDEFARLVAEPAATLAFDHVIFDTAPTGHTLRLLALPAAWTGFFAEGAAGTSCIGPLRGLGAQRALYQAALERLSDGAQTRLVLVSRPERVSLEEAARTASELAALGMRNQALVVNGGFAGNDPRDPVAGALARRAREALAAMPAALAALPRSDIELRSRELIGAESLRALLSPEREVRIAAAVAPPRAPELRELLETLAAQPRGLVMTMGKGGVGKTAIAVRVARALQRRGHVVHLTTTDPAAHVERMLGDRPERLSVGRIDPAAEVERYREEVLAGAGAQLDAAARSLIEEDLRSPCTEEIAVFRAFAREVARAADCWTVIDTAPTGHTILLLDAAQAYHRELARQSRSVSSDVRALLPRLRDPAFTHILLVTLPEATPVHEAAALQQDLRRAGIEPRAWIVNQSLLPLEIRDRVLGARRARERRYFNEVVNVLARETYLVPWQDAPHEGEALGRLARAEANGCSPRSHASI